MRLLRTVSRSVFYLAAATLVAGCGVGSVIEEVRQRASDAANWERDRDQLSALGMTWHVFHQQHRRSPADWSELLAHDPTLEELQDRGCVITWWGRQLAEAVGGISNTILAYFPGVEKEGGAVLLLDGSVYRMTAEQFNNPDEFFRIRRRPPPPKQAAVQPRPSAATPSAATAPDSRPMLGVRVYMGSWSRQPALVLFDPLFDRKTVSGPGQSIIARDGYAVGALRIHAGTRVDAVQVVFMRQQQDGRLDPGDAYGSPWVGTPSHGEAITVGGQGIPVIGVHGRRAAIIDALGLVLSSP